MRLCWLVALAYPVLLPSAVWANPPPANTPSSTNTSNPPTTNPPITNPRGTPPIEVEVENPPELPSQDHRAASVVTREDIEARQVRSAPEALRQEPGVFIQQTSHAQASPYIRGLTGQQTLLLFDGVRLNNSTFRQGPNQYFFSVDARSVAKIEVVRGSSSTFFGADALGGAILSSPIEPTLAPNQGWSVHSRATLNSRSADHEVGGRGQLDLGYGDTFGIVGGYGYRDVGLLEAAGPVKSPLNGEIHKSPRFFADWRTQRGTGFREGAGDIRLVWKPHPALRLTLATYDYRQHDAPRTDKCPPPEAREDECMVYLEQFRLLSYGALDWHAGRAALDHLRLTVSYQRQREWRYWFRDNLVPEIPGGTEYNDRDNVHTWGGSIVGQTRAFDLGPRWSVQGRYGADGYGDLVDSQTWQRFTDLTPVKDISLPRGQYIDGSRYFTGGAYFDVLADLAHRWQLAAGGRLGAMAAYAPSDVTIHFRPLRRGWFAFAGRMSSNLRLGQSWQWVVNVDQGFRAPNLDDLTSRQQIGPGFQLENRNLEPERSTAYETGLRWRTAIFDASAYGFHTRIHDFMARRPRDVDACPPGDNGPAGCNASRSRFQLDNLSGVARLFGAELMLSATWPKWLRVRTTASYVWGDSRNPLPKTPSQSSQNVYEARVPLSRVPPLNGSTEVQWLHQKGWMFGASVRWALAQDRLALADTFDVRIPKGGTPGFGVFDLRVMYRPDPCIALHFYLENLLDAPYRQHGSSINGPGRSLNASLILSY